MSYQLELGIGKAFVIGTAALMLASSVAVLADPIIKPYFSEKKPPLTVIPGDLSTDTNGASGPVSNAGALYTFGFEGISQYDGATLGRNFIPPDTMGAVGRTQYVETSNSAYAVFDKATGNRLSLVSDVAFWAAAGQTGTHGDSRVMYNAAASRWIVVAFGDNVADLQIAVSDTDNALGTWKSTKFTGFATGTADYPTLALDRNAVYIGTNNFKVGCNPANPTANALCGTTLNVIPLDSLFNAGAPSVANMKAFVSPFDRTTNQIDRGFALQGVNDSTPGSTGTVLAASLVRFDNLAFNVNGLTSSSALLSSLTNPTFLGMASFQSPGPGRQPAVAVPENRRVIDTLDERLSSSVYQANGRIYMVNTVNSIGDGLDEARIRYTVIDAYTFALLDQGNIGVAGYDYYQPSIAVNADGDVVIGYNRSGLDPLTGKIGFFARTFLTDINGKLVPTSGEIFLKDSLTDDYHNGSVFGEAAVDRQRWGDYSQVSIDPDNGDIFWLIGEFAREYNLPEFGHPNGTGGARWSTWIATIDVTDATAVPAPATWLLVVFGCAIGFIRIRRRRAAVRFLAA